MHIDNSIVLTLVLNIGLILAFSWLGIKIINENSLHYRFNTQDNSQVSKLAKETSVITPRIKTTLKVRRMIKTNSDNDETPFFLPQLALK